MQYDSVLGEHLCDEQDGALRRTLDHLRVEAGPEGPSTHAGALRRQKTVQYIELASKSVVLT